jgi:hypothetical protein
MQGRRGGVSYWAAIDYCNLNIDQADQFMLTRLTFTAADGTEFELRDQLTDGKPAYLLDVLPCSNTGNSRGQVFVTADGTSATFISDTPIFDYKFSARSPTSNNHRFSPSGYLLFKDGTRYRISGGLVTEIQDRNGNRVSFTYVVNGSSFVVSTITDSLNRQVTITYNNGTTQHDLITFKGANGVARTIKV